MTTASGILVKEERGYFAGREWLYCRKSAVIVYSKNSGLPKFAPHALEPIPPMWLKPKMLTYLNLPCTVVHRTSSNGLTLPIRSSGLYSGGGLVGNFSEVFGLKLY